MDQYEIAQVLREMGIALELTDPNPKKGIAYFRAAKILESIDNFDEILRQDKLETFPWIGKSLSKFIKILATKGYLPYYFDLKKKVPPGLFDLALIPGIGTRRIRILYEKFKIENLSDLDTALKENKRVLPGFTPSSIKKMSQQIENFKKYGISLLYFQAEKIALQFLEILKDDVELIEIAGELRRKCELVSWIEIVLVAKDRNQCLSKIANHFLISSILKRKDNELWVQLKQGIKFHFYFSEKSNFPLALFYCTGNDLHVLDIENIGRVNRIQLSDTAFVLEGKDQKIKNEHEIYRLLHLPFIEPELREGLGEIAAAKQGKLPCLVNFEDLRGTFHCHTIDSDGSNTIEEIVSAVQSLGWEYIGISDHSKASYQANGMNEEKLFNQIEMIKKLNGLYLPKFQIFSGIECDILKDGTLDFDDAILKNLDFVIVSIHRRFNLDEEGMTKRLIRAIENPYTTMVGHLTGRLLRSRQPYQLNVPKILDACIKNGKIIELNAYPSRLDMDWRLWIKAKEKGLKCSINPDAHSLSDLKNCIYGINMARKGWLEKNDVINTLALDEMRLFLKTNKLSWF